MKPLAAGLTIALLTFSMGTHAQAPQPAPKTAPPAAKAAAPAAKPAAPASLITADLLSGLQFRNIGPAIM